ncbi:peptidoglycan-binding domain-containing protein [Streptomyces sp. NPDC046876]|uniref:peptidoglycan-binding domain-containing protein n=1 Tax=Streptomyces sp. NPDC046876 TaxID=3155616 RepID=UPI0033C2E79B
MTSPAPTPGHGSSPRCTPAIAAAVRAVQEQLNAASAKVTTDGRYGAATTTAVRAFQSKHHLTVDGVIGADTWRSCSMPAGADTDPPPCSTAHAPCSEGGTRVPHSPSGCGRRGW